MVVLVLAEKQNNKCTFLLLSTSRLTRLRHTILWSYLFLQIFGWLPEPYNSTKLPDDMPQDIKNIINDTSMPSKKNDGMIWFSCEGENPADRENIGPIRYYPDPGVPTFFYPYKNQDGYHSPAVFAHFEDPKRKQFSEMYSTYTVCCSNIHSALYLGS